MQWTLIDGFSQGNVTALCTFDNGYLGATTYDDGFYASFNNGLLWTMMSYYPNFHFYSIMPGPYLSHIFLAGIPKDRTHVHATYIFDKVQKGAKIEKN